VSASSRARERESDTSAAFAAAYVASPGVGIVPAIEARLTT
jgi:hypothetical protein